MNKSLLLASLIAVAALTACGKKEVPVATPAPVVAPMAPAVMDAASAPVDAAAAAAAAAAASAASK